VGYAVEAEKIVKVAVVVLAQKILGYFVQYYFLLHFPDAFQPYDN